MADDARELAPPEDDAVGLDIAVDRLDAKTVRLTVCGQLDLSTSDGLEREIDAQLVDRLNRSIVLDLRELSFLDSTGLRALWTARQHALSVDATLVLDAPSDPVLRILRMTKLDKVFQVTAEGSVDGEAG